MFIRSMKFLMTVYRCTMEAWNEEADESNQWAELGWDEKSELLSGLLVPKELDLISQQWEDMEAEIARVDSLNEEFKKVAGIGADTGAVKVAAEAFGKSLRSDSEVTPFNNYRFVDSLSGAELISLERKRQVEEEGYDAECDAKHSPGSLPLAASLYAYDVGCELDFPGDIETSICPNKWPWDEKWWKPTPDDPIKQLVKAGALIAAAIDRLQAEERS